MISDVIIFILGVLVGGGAVLAYLHKHTAKAVVVSAAAAADVAALKTDINAIKAKA